MAMIAPRRKRATRPGAARSTRVSGSALGGTALAGVSTGSVMAVSPLRLHRGDPHDLLFLETEEIGRAHVCTPVTNAHPVCRLLLVTKKITKHLLKTPTTN